ncbi:SHOCT domain-containing protein [Streptomyces sp. NBC_01218]|uniref:SHOCT domain-containing protein n=1 Tax=unclassified Streptomyces TaxID=2593676 RepID=UPI0023B99E53|nr:MULTISPECIES: PLDc N-terminal domain-containing protein [unclassified Streptomyces]WEH41413.1 PLDc N-terminal domain-containing protein [Streptomyces sp. AM 2-1-1]WSQ53043.1 SHOCT domain-containing protein [Streptomyces sp. NBC_01218]
MNDGVYLAYDYPVLGAFWTAMWVFIWVLWLVLLFRIIADIFRDDDMGGLAKTVWLLVVIFLPYIGVFAYVIARGRGMGSREHRHAKDQQHAFETYIRETAGGSGGLTPAEQISKLSEVRARGDISDEEFQRAKEKILA